MGVLEGQIALVTGGNRGIGLGIARAFAQAGASVVIAARDAERLAAAAAALEALGAATLAHATDVTDAGDVTKLFEATLDRFGRLDILVNNAGIGRSAPLAEMDVADWDATIATNLRGPFLCTQAAMRAMIQQGKGRIINVASISSQRVRPHSAPYSASKFGLWGLTQVTALEGREHGISCSCLNPGNTRVERREHGERPQDAEPMMTPDELAQVAVTMAAMPAHISVLEATVLPVTQAFVGRG